MRFDFGVKARFFPPSRFIHPFGRRVFTGKELKGFLLDHRVYRQIVPGEAPLLVRTPHGVWVRTSEPKLSGNFAGQPSHEDDVLVACAEVGLPSDSMLYTTEGEGTIADVVRESIARFHDAPGT